VAGHGWRHHGGQGGRVGEGRAGGQVAEEKVGAAQAGGNRPQCCRRGKGRCPVELRYPSVPLFSVCRYTSQEGSCMYIS